MLLLGSFNESLQPFRKTRYNKKKSWIFRWSRFDINFMYVLQSYGKVNTMVALPNYQYKEIEHSRWRKTNRSASCCFV